MIDLFDIKGNVTVITGGTGVLGRTIAKYLALHGAEVIILGRKIDVGKAIIVDIYEALGKQTKMAPTGKTVGGSVEFMKTDVMNQQMVEENCKMIMSKYGRVDTLLNAAGGNMSGATIPPDKTFFDLSAEAFSQVLNLNLMGTVIPTQVFLKPMVKQEKGSIINFTSMTAFRPITRV